MHEASENMLRAANLYNETSCIQRGDFNELFSHLQNLVYQAEQIVAPTPTITPVESQPTPVHVTTLPLGTRFKYAGFDSVYVLLDKSRGGTSIGLIARWTGSQAPCLTQEVFSLAGSKAEYESLMVEIVE